MLPRILEPELMDTAKDAQEYDAMDHAAVNAQFVDDLLTAVSDWSLQRPVEPPLTILDLGAGTAQIPIELCRRSPNVHVVAVDAAQSMLAVARENVKDAGLARRIELIHADAKQLSVGWASPTSKQRSRTVGDAHPMFPVVISNSIIHHIAEPRGVVEEAIRVTAPGGLLFHRDLARPQSEAELEQIVATYAAGATPYQRKLFSDSLRAALSLEEMRDLITTFGFAPDSVQMTSDRHWTWVATNSWEAII